MPGYLKKDNALRLHTFLEAGVYYGKMKLSYETKLERKQDPLLGKPILCSRDLETVFRTCFNPETIELYEEAWLLLMNRSRKIIGTVPLSTGGIASTVLDPMLVLGSAIITASLEIAVAHNHPSGSYVPSKQDKDFTHSLSLAAKTHNITLLDSLILTKEGYFSFADDGLLII